MIVFPCCDSQRSLQVEGVDYRWTEEDFFTLIRDSVGNVPIIKTYMTWEGGKLTGEGIIELGTYADAMKVRSRVAQTAQEVFCEQFRSYVLRGQSYLAKCRAKPRAHCDGAPDVGGCGTEQAGSLGCAAAV